MCTYVILLGTSVAAYDIFYIGNWQYFFGWELSLNPGSQPKEYWKVFSFRDPSACHIYQEINKMKDKTKLK